MDIKPKVRTEHFHIFPTLENILPIIWDSGVREPEPLPNPSLHLPWKQGEEEIRTQGRRKSETISVLVYPFVPQSLWVGGKQGRNKGQGGLRTGLQGPLPIMSHIAILVHISSLIGTTVRP